MIYGVLFSLDDINPFFDFLSAVVQWLLAPIVLYGIWQLKQIYNTAQQAAAHASAANRAVNCRKEGEPTILEMTSEMYNWVQGLKNGGKVESPLKLNIFVNDTQMRLDAVEQEIQKICTAQQLTHREIEQLRSQLLDEIAKHGCPMAADRKNNSGCLQNTSKLQSS